MGLRINNNITALNAHRQLTNTDRLVAKSLEKLSSGYRINRSADDATGLAISQGMRAQIVGLKQASRNSSEATNLIQTAEGASNEIHSMLIRLRELAVQASSANVSDTNRVTVNQEATYLTSEITRIAQTTKYNGVSLLDGTFGGSTWAADGTSVTASKGLAEIELSGAASGTYTFVNSATNDNSLSLGNGTTTQTITSISVPGNGSTTTLNFSDLGVKVKINNAFCDATANFNNGYINVTASTTSTFQIGSDNGVNNRLEVGILSMTASALTVNSISLSTQSGAQTAIDTIDTAIASLSSRRGTLGASQNRLAYTISTLDNTAENIQASESSIRDVDMALEMTSFTRSQIMVQAGTAMLAQANSLPQNVLSLFR